MLLKTNKIVWMSLSGPREQYSVCYSDSLFKPVPKVWQVSFPALLNKILWQNLWNLNYRYENQVRPTVRMLVWLAIPNMSVSKFTPIALKSSFP